MTPSDACLDLIRDAEQCRLHAYPDPGTGGAPWTIGWGHTGPEVRPGLVWTQEQADEAFERDIEQFSSQVAALFPRTELTQGQFDALVSFAYNCGLGALSTSTLRKRLLAGDADGAAEEFQRWNKAGGKVLAGLTTRRAAECALFLEGVVA